MSVKKCTLSPNSHTNHFTHVSPPFLFFFFFLPFTKTAGALAFFTARAARAPIHILSTSRRNTIATY